MHSRRLRIGVDSCAAVSVMPEDVCLDYPLNEKGKGRKYMAANNTSIIDRGSRNLAGIVKGRTKVSNFNLRVRKVRLEIKSTSVTPRS